MQGKYRSFAGVLKYLAAVMLVCVSAYADKIGKIVIEPVNSQLEKGTLEEIAFSVIASRPGEELNPLLLSEDLKKLMLSKKLDDVKVRTERQDNGDVTVIFTLTPKPLVAEINFQGNTVYGNKRLKNVLTQKTGVQLDEDALAKDRAAILKKYRDTGYYTTEVSTLKTPKEDGSGISITFVVKEEGRRKLKKVYFKNNTVFTEDQLRQAVVTQRQWWRYILRFGNYYNADQLPLDKDRLLRLYGSKGYMDFAVADVEEKTVDGNWVELTFVLEEGPQYTVDKISVLGNTIFTSDTMLKNTFNKEGNVHNSNLEDLDLGIMKAEYEKLGYMDLKIRPSYTKNTEARTVSVEYRVFEGTPSRIRNVDITGNTITRDEVIRRELAIAPGDMGDSGKIRASKQRLQNMGYFDSVEILPVGTEIPDVKDLRVELSEKPTGNLSLGAGFSSEDSAIGFVEFSETNFDLARLLKMEWPPKGDGQKLQARLQIGSDVSNVSLSHTEPWFLDRRLELTTDLFIRNRFEDEYDQRNIGAGMMLSWPVSFRIPGFDHIENWRMGVGFRVESIRISDVDKHGEEFAMDRGDFVRNRIIADEKDNYTVNRLIWRASRDTRNAYMFPTSGSRITLQTELVTEALGSYETYGRFSLGATKYIPFFRDVVLKLDANYFSSTGDDVAIFDRYFAGGIGTVRGFKRRDVAPVDRFEDPLGGNSMLTGTIELIKPVKNFMFISTFLDAGNAWWDDFEMDLGDLNYSVGLGIQFRALPISIYYGVPVSTTYDHLHGKSGRLHFNIGISY